MRVLVVGGAGYIGSHAVRRLIASGHEPRVLDNLSLGHAESIPKNLLLSGDLADRESLERVFKGESFDAVMHFAAFASVPESVSDPAKYYRNNVIGSLNLLDAMRSAGVKRIVFSSTAATYGTPERSPIVETTPQRPINPYGFTKLVIEHALADYAAAYGLGYAVLRYFNACGASDDASIGEDHTPETHLIPLILQVALGQREAISIFGTDYPTPDGTCIRDYIHVEDLADVHALVIDHIKPGEGMHYNVATGRGYSVREVIEAARRVTGRSIKAVEQPRRQGDPAELVASPEALRKDLGWTPRYTEIEKIVASAWAWHVKRPGGYASPADLQQGAVR
jgi:UDP-glucose 4-epimerase